MAQFTVNPDRFDPYRNFKFQVRWDNRIVAGVAGAGNSCAGPRESRHSSAVARVASRGGPVPSAWPTVMRAPNIGIRLPVALQKTARYLSATAPQF